VAQYSKENGKFDFVWVMGWDLKPCKTTYCMHNFGGGIVQYSCCLYGMVIAVVNVLWMIVSCLTYSVQF